MSSSGSSVVWQPLGFRSFQLIEEGLGRLLEHIAQHVSRDSFELLLILVWSIWKERNEFIWKGVEVSPMDIQIKAQAWLAEFKIWNEVAVHTSVQTLTR